MMRGRICDPETGLDVAPGEQGEMLLQGPSKFLNRASKDPADFLILQISCWDTSTAQRRTRKL